MLDVDEIWAVHLAVEPSNQPWIGHGPKIMPIKFKVKAKSESTNPCGIQTKHKAYSIRQMYNIQRKHTVKTCFPVNRSVIPSSTDSTCTNMNYPTCGMHYEMITAQKSHSWGTITLLEEFLSGNQHMVNSH